SCEDLRHCRTMWSVVYSCLLTVFACIWTAFHPDVESNSTRSRLGSHISRMLNILVLPEFAVGEAWHDFSMACRISKKCDEIQGWTHAHSHFVVMGGFFDPSKQKAVVPDKDEDPVALFEKYPGIIGKSGDRRKVAINEEQILDKSKGDHFSKSIVTIQLLWFTAQYIGRWAAHIHRSQLETTTLAYAVLSILAYGLWWHKPLDVH
ncbi:uncharacterized protein EI90DRAFT_2887740, partial [Cantharellus anzutake]|uniref:uncharacterized protein n=1 Tax=Cantharellus anzutake TaxID=1750568 RepID=UPI001904C811